MWVGMFSGGSLACCALCKVRSCGGPTSRRDAERGKLRLRTEMAQPSSRPPPTVTATSETSVDGLGQHEAETCPLCELPDVPFLHIFSYLRNEDGESLFAVAQACPRVSAFPSLWDGKKVNLGTSPRYFGTSIEDLRRCARRDARRAPFLLSESMWTIEQEREHARSWGGEELSKDTHCYPLDRVDEVIQARSLALLRVAPPVDTLVLSNLCEEGTSILRTYTYFETYAEFRSYSSGGSGSLRLSLNHPLDIASLIEKIGPALKHLESSVAVPLASLDHAQNLETLDLNVGSMCVEASPQSLSLPRLHTVRLRYFTDTAPLNLDEALLYAELLLLALPARCDHVRCVALCSPDLMPLLDACPADLQRLSICWPAPGLAARLGRFQGLKDLSVELDDDEDDEELESLLRACSGPLERLELVGMSRGEPVRAVGAAGLTSLTSLVLNNWLLASSYPPDLRHVALALSGLPRLRLLDLENFSTSPEVVRGVPLAAIATLELLIMDDDLQDPELVTAVKELVLRAPKQLHVGLEVRYRVYALFFRHSAAESECVLCAEFAATVGSKEDGRSAQIEKSDVAE